MGAAPTSGCNASWHSILTVDEAKQAGLLNDDVNHVKKQGQHVVPAMCKQDWLKPSFPVQVLFLRRVLFLHDRAVRRGVRGANIRLQLAEWCHEAASW